MSKVHSVNKIIFLLSVAQVKLYGKQRNGSSLVSSKEQKRSLVKLSMEKTHFQRIRKRMALVQSGSRSLHSF